MIAPTMQMMDELLRAIQGVDVDARRRRIEVTLLSLAEC